MDGTPGLCMASDLSYRFGADHESLEFWPTTQLLAELAQLFPNAGGYGFLWKAAIVGM